MRNKNNPFPKPEIPAHICSKCNGKANECEVIPGVRGYYCPRCGNTWLLLPDSEVEEINELTDED